MKSKITQVVLMPILVPPIVLYAFNIFENYLLNSGFLNKVDLIPVGIAKGTVLEYLTNVWCWDALFIMLVLLSVLSMCYGVVRLVGRDRDRGIR